MNAAVRLDDAAHLIDAQPKRRVLERLLHLAATKDAEVAAVRVRVAVRVLAGEVGKLGLQVGRVAG